MEIIYTGLRPGEKLFEELLIASSNALPTAHPKIMQADEPCMTQAALQSAVIRLREAVQAGDEAIVRSVLTGAA